ncbi:flagellar protein FlaG [Cohnella terricola]|uniref:Flagellar protein FlaG n=1 Tax=Cohnella terricola TaxID=1289167 RepID=A0A559J8B0_9BACL|nr:flagellar protein FlaG [Cohnella terricola]TVX96104.1 flagellar protein FlaG [Cohnella terricola]
MEIQVAKAGISPNETVKINFITNKVTGQYSELKEKEKYEILSVSEVALLSAISKANHAAQGSDLEFNYKVHKETGDVIVQIMNKDTKEIVREIPPEKLIELIEKLQELTKGALINETR